jgi:hypothetical protein
MPTSALDTFSAQKLEPAIVADQAVTVGVPMVAAVATVAKGTVLGMVTASKLFKAYANANVDGSEVAKVIAMYDFTVDVSGNVFLSHEKSVARKLAPAYCEGYFRTEDLTGLDAAGVADLGRIVSGDLTAGLLHVS